ncbi:hypothetical protein RUND412_009436 [Rhizina undulata]
MSPHTNEHSLHSSSGISLSLSSLALHGESGAPSSTTGHSNKFSDAYLSRHAALRGNGFDCAHRPLLPGVYAPTVAFFDPATEELDIPTIRKHTVRLAEAGLVGLVTQGSNGEAVHLSHSERRDITAATREALDDAGYHSMPVIVGCGGQSTRETIELCHDALLSGGDYAMILPPAYYKQLYTAQSQFEFFTDVADESPIPILIYNYPGAVAGIDLDSDVVTKLSKHPNIIGCKLTCGNTGKLCRVANDAPIGFMTMGGSSDFTLQTLVAGGNGIIGGLANIAPRACAEVFNLYVSGKIQEAKVMQAVVGRGDWGAIKGGVVGTKSCLRTCFGYGGHGRKPLPRPTPEQDAAYKADFQELLLLEEFLTRGRREQDVHGDKSKEFPQLVELERMLLGST